MNKKILIDKLKLEKKIIPVETRSNKAEIASILDFYVSTGLSLVPIARGQKIPVEKEWQNKIHVERKEWEDWIDKGLNIGIKCGKDSNVTVIDIDQDPKPTELQDIFNKYPKTLQQKSNKGYHYFYVYESQLPTTRIDELKTDILNDGKQCVSFPSIVDGIERKLIAEVIQPIPEELKKFLQSKITVPVKSFSEKTKEDILKENVLDDLNIAPIPEGNRTNALLRIGGILRKELNLQQTSFTLQIINRNFCKPSLPIKELDGVINSLDKYVAFDEQELALRILHYLRIVEEASSRDIQDVLGERTPEGKQRIEKAISYLVKEEFLIKKHRVYKIIKKIEWKEDWFDEGKTIDYMMPYFDETSTFRNGDMIIIGGKQKVGKTHIALNIVKRLVKQNKKPYYISLESGSRFAVISDQLQLKEGDFFYNKEIVKPEEVELEDNAITIIDWLLPNDYAETDKIFLHLSNQLKKHGGNLIVFVQLKTDGKFFAENMISMFPALVAKYFYKNEDDGVDGYFQVEYMRESKIKRKTCQIYCKYDWDTKELLMLKEILPTTLITTNIQVPTT